MGKHETIVPIEPPAQRAPAVIAHLQTCRRALAAAEQEIPGLLLAVAEARPRADRNLAALREKIAAAQFVIEHHAKARERARYTGIVRISVALGALLALLMFYVMLTSNLTGLNYAVSKARERAEQIDREAAVAFKADVQKMPPDQILAGITKDACPRRCIAGGCAITGSDEFAGTCQHPLIGGALDQLRYRASPHIMRLYGIACEKIGLKRLDA